MTRRLTPKRFDKNKHPQTGLYPKKGRWWLRVKAPSGRVALKSTGAAIDHVGVANAIVDMLDYFRGRREDWPRIEAVVNGTISLAEMYKAFRDGDAQVERTLRAAGRVDLEPLVARWQTHQKANDENVQDDTVDDYVRFVRALIPAGTPTYVEQLDRAAFQAYLATPARGNAPTVSTKRNRLFAFTKFLKWLRAEGLDVSAPLATIAQLDKLPTPEARKVAWQDFAALQTVLGLVPNDEHRVALALLFGTGMELSALRAVKPVDVIADSRLVRARGTKNEGRDRVVFVRAWAWPLLASWAQGKPATEPLFPTVRYGDALRDALYAAQIAAGVAKPGDDLHTLHDARHTFCCLASLGRDGDVRLTERQLADQLGHKTTEMVQKIYNNFRLAEQVRALEEADRIAAAVAADATPRLSVERGSANGSKPQADEAGTRANQGYLKLVSEG